MWEESEDVGGLEEAKKSILDTLHVASFHGVGEVEWPTRRRNNGAASVKLEGFVDEGDSSAAGEDGSPAVGRTKSLTDDDLDELKGCLDLGFGFSYEEILELCRTSPALELCYSMSQRFLDEQKQRSTAGYHDVGAASPVRVANWKISNPGSYNSAEDFIMGHLVGGSGLQLF